MFGNEETLANVNQLLILQQKQENAMGFDFDSVFQSSYKLFASMYSESGIEGNTTTEGQSTTSHQMSENQYNDDIVIMVEPSKTETSFNTFGVLDLPVQVQLHIFSFLTAQDLSQASQSCRTWNDLCSDHLLWKRLLNIDQHQWNTVSHSTNPAVYRAVNSDLSQKEIYSRCCPHAQSVTGLRFSIPRLFRSLVLKKPPKIVMFGPGLECDDTSSIVRKFLGERPEIFKTCGGFPGEFPGSIGTGFYVQVENTFQIRLITLYSGTRKERENQNVSQRASRNKLLVAAAARDEQDIEIDNQENNGENPFDASHSVRALCRTVDAFIFVLNASTSATTSVSEGKPELLTIMNERWTHPSIPLLILSCVKNDDVTRVSCITVADQLQLHNMNRVWKMYNCNIQTLDGVTDGIKWVKGAVDSR